MPAGKTTSQPSITDLLDPDFLARLDALDVLSRKIFQGKLAGERISKRRGRSVEFADHRRYVPGDDLRFVDWNIFARMDMFFLKLFLAEEDLSVEILLDGSESMGSGEPAKAAVARKLAAALAYVGLVNNNRVTVSTFADGLTARRANLRGRHRMHRVVELLLGGKPQGPTLFTSACRQAAAARTGSGVMVVISDFLFKGGYEEGLRRLIGGNYDLYVIQMLSPQEMSPDLSGDLELVDIEDGDAAEVTINAALMNYYKRNLTAYCDELKGFCTSRGATYALVSTEDSVEDLMLKYLRRRGLLG
ncbi:MAG: DUF58 domain-containing protein [Phycisphaerae bacterium]